MVKVICPKCGHDMIDYVENVCAHHRVVASGAGVYVVGNEADWHSDTTFRSGEGRFQCVECTHEWPAPDDFYNSNEK